MVAPATHRQNLSQNVKKRRGLAISTSAPQSLPVCREISRGLDRSRRGWSRSPIIHLSDQGSDRAQAGADHTAEPKHAHEETNALREESRQKPYTARRHAESDQRERRGDHQERDRAADKTTNPNAAHHRFDEPRGAGIAVAFARGSRSCSGRVRVHCHCGGTGFCDGFASGGFAYGRPRRLTSHARAPTSSGPPLIHSFGSNSPCSSRPLSPIE